MTLCLVDAWYGGEENLREYLENCPEGEGFDPPHGGSRQMANPFFNSREYFLAVMSRRITQATKEMTVLIETFDERMVVYVSIIPLIGRLRKILANYFIQSGRQNELGV